MKIKAKEILKKILPGLLFVFLVHSYRFVVNLFIQTKMFFSALIFFKCRSIVTCDNNGRKFDIIIDPKNGAVDNILYYKKSYEEDLVNKLSKYLSVTNGDFLDIGANIGYYSMSIASIFSRQGIKRKVHSFEPIDFIANQMLQSVRINNFDNLVNVHSFGLSNKKEDLLIHFSDHGICSSSVHFYSGTNKINKLISLEKFDDLDIFRDTTIGLIKIDVEGHEPEAIEGMKFKITKDRPVIMLEFTAYIYRSDNRIKEAYEMLSFFVLNEYRLYDFFKDTEILNIKGFIDSTENDDVLINVLLLPKEISYIK